LKVSGPQDDDFLLHKDGVTDEANACQSGATAITISLSATLDPGDNNNLIGLIEGDAVDNKFQQAMNLVWTKCS
jgi:hypothetical protein